MDNKQSVTPLFVGGTLLVFSTGPALSQEWPGSTGLSHGDGYIAVDSFGASSDPQVHSITYDAVGTNVYHVWAYSEYWGYIYDEFYPYGSDTKGESALPDENDARFYGWGISCEGPPALWAANSLVRGHKISDGLWWGVSGQHYDGGYVDTCTLSI